MATPKIDQAFVNANNQVNRVLSNVAMKSAQDIRKDVLAFLRDYSQNFYFRLYPYMQANLQSRYPAYRKNYTKHKFNKGIPLPSFWQYGFHFKDEGGLQDALEDRNPIRDFGAPKAEITVKGKSLRAGFTSNSLGQVRIATGQAGAGQFASFAQAFRKLDLKVNAEIFPLLVGDSLSEVTKKYDKRTRFKILANEGGSRKRNIRARPMLIPTLKWYRTTNFRAAFKEKF